MHIPAIKTRFTRGWQAFTRHVSPAWVAVLLTILIVFPYLFLNPIHGYADNGDFWRAIYPNGIYPFAAKDRTDYFNFVTPHYHIMQYFNENKMEVYSSQTLFIQVALFLNRLFYSKTIFDLRFLSGIYFLLFLGAIYLLTVALTHPLRRVRSYLIALMVVFVFADSAYTLYFNSFFAEPVSYLGMLYAVAAWLLLARKTYRWRWPLLLTYFVSTVMFIASKQQNAPIALSFMLVAVGALFLPNFKKHWVALLSGMAVILISGVVTFALISKLFGDVNVFQAFSYGVLVETDDPTKAITKDGLDGQYALMRNEPYNPPSYAPVLPSDAYIEKHLTTRLSTAWVVKYYLKHPMQLVKLMDVAGKNLMVVQLRAVGDYTKSSGAKPLQQSHYFTGWSLLAETFYPRKFAFNVMLALVYIMVFAVGFYADLKRGLAEGPMRFFLILGLLSILIFVPPVSVIGSGISDLAKHLFAVPVTVSLLLVILIADGLSGRLWHAWREADDEA